MILDLSRHTMTYVVGGELMSIFDNRARLHERENIEIINLTIFYTKIEKQMSFYYP